MSAPDSTEKATRIDRDDLEESPSTGWRDVYRILDVDADRAAAMTRMDRPPRYRRKHRHGVTS